LDALHLATALRLAEAAAVDLVFLTHDAELALAAQSVTFLSKESNHGRISGIIRYAVAARAEAYTAVPFIRQHWVR